MDADRFDELARLIAVPADRRAVLRRILMGGVAAVAAVLVPDRAGLNSTLAAPAEIAEPSRIGRARQVPRSVSPTVRQTTKGVHQIAPAGTPAVSVSPASGKVKSQVTLTLSGFHGSEAISILWFDGSVSKTVASGMASSGGKAVITFTAPYAFRGYHTLRAVGNKGSKADTKFAIVPSISISPRHGFKRTEIHATMSGFASKAQVQVLLYSATDGSAGGTTSVLATVTLSPTGSGGADFTIPYGIAIGSHRIEGREVATGRLASARYSAVQCNSSSDCLAPANECQKSVCTAGVCGTSNVAVGHVTFTQTLGDCQNTICDGHGGFTTRTDDSDTPTPESVCAPLICSGGSPVAGPYAARGTVCSDNGGARCDGTGSCVMCVENSDCESGSHCVDGLCLDLMMCETVDDCPAPTNPGCARATCDSGMCGISAVNAGTVCSDNGGTICDGLGSCLVCTPNEIRSCYTGPDGTVGNGICKSGSQSCGSDGSAWGPCNDQITPASAICNGLDNDCDGHIDQVNCTIPNGIGNCTAGGCGIVSCNQGFGDCDLNVANGCETDLRSDHDNCGACGHSCAGAQNCVEGHCTS